MNGRAQLVNAALLGALPADLQEELLAAAEPARLDAQEWLFREGDPADHLYLLVSGRLRVIVVRDGEPRVLRLLGPGAAIGELAILTQSPRSASIQAVRDSELLQLDGERFLALLERNPDLGVALARALAQQLQESGGLSEPDVTPTVFAVTATPGLDVQPFCNELLRALETLGSVTPVQQIPHEDWSTSLATLEAANDFVLLLAPADGGAWSEFCLRQADRVAVVAAGPPPPEFRAPAGCDVVFLDASAARTLRDWNATCRPRAHHVARAGDADAVARVARRLAGRSLGLVLSGGGARAFAHLGVLQVLAEEGIAIDRVGGTSMGSFIAAMVASGRPVAEMIEIFRADVARPVPLTDYTVPRYSLLKARSRGESLLRELFGEMTVEELPRPLFTVSADLVSGQMVVHREGSLVEAVATSMTIPGLLPPRLREEQVLIDGGILNNLPVDVMVAGEPGPVVAVDVMRRVDAADLQAAGRSALPTILETLARATVLGSIERAESNRRLASLMITPDVQGLGLRDFRRINEALDAGRRAGEAALAAGGKERLQVRRPSPAEALTPA